jgi:chemotaxis protein histidine kinase CheA
MGKKTMSITRALAEVKLYEKRLLNNYVGFDTKINNKLVNNSNLTEEQFLKDVKANKESFDKLFENRRVVKSAIAKANVETKVEFKLGKKTDSYSIIELIDLKTSLSYKIDRLNNLERQYNLFKQSVEQQEHKIEQEVSRQVESAMTNKNQTSKDLTKTLTDTYTQMWGAEIVGLNIDEIRYELENLNYLLDEIDMTLSEVNAKTEIEVDI